MNTFKEFLFSFLEASRERLKNPVIGAFFLAWVTINWRIISILFWSDKTVENRIEYIEQNYFDENINFWIPLMVVGFYAFLLPYLMLLIEALSQTAIKLRKEFSSNQKVQDIISKQTIAAEEWQLQIIKEGSPDIGKLKTEIEILKKELTDAKNQQIAISKPQFSDGRVKSVNIKEPKESGIKELPKVRKKKTSQASDKTQESPKKEVSFDHEDLPSMTDIVMRDLAKTESEWILVYSLFAGELGKKDFNREDLVNMYEQTKRMSRSRRNNLGNNLKTLTKQNMIRHLNDNDMLLTSSGLEKAKDILNR